jgi:predicted permease
VAAGLFVRTFASLSGRPLGFDAAHVMNVTLSLPQSDRRSNDERIARYHRARDAAAAVRGVRSAALSVLTPFNNFQWQSELQPADAPSMSAEDRVFYVNAVSPGWFDTVGTPRHAGSDVATTTTAKGPRNVVVNDAFVRRFLSGRHPIGQVVHEVTEPGEPATDSTIVGVVADALYDSIRDEAPPTMYLPLEKTGLPATEMVLNVRLAEEPASSVASDLAVAIAQSTPDLTFEFRPMAEQVNARLVRERTIALLAGFFGSLALVLAGLGLFGVVSYSVGRRRTEIGIRLALGARPSSVVWLVGSRVAVLVGAGIVGGLALSWWGTRFAATLLFGLKPTDHVTFFGAAVVLGLVGLLAAAVPAFRASRTDAATVLREG